MTTDRQLVRNRANSRLSTGPRTDAGLATSSQNARRHGLYTNAVIPEVGESLEEFEALRDALHAELLPDGVFEGRLVDRVALLWWRLDRVARYEAAAARAAVLGSAIPADPDTVTGEGFDTCFPPHPEGRPADRLAYARARVRDWAPCRDACREAADALGGSAGSAGPIPPRGLSAVVSVVGQGFGWPGGEADRRWDEAVRDRPAGQPFDGPAFRSLVVRLAQGAGREPDDVVHALRDLLVERASSYDRSIAAAESDAARLSDGMRATRERMAAAALYADGEATERVIRMEGHLMRQMESALAQLRRLRGEDAAVVAGLGVVVGGARAGALPVGSFRGRDGEIDAGDGSVGGLVVSNRGRSGTRVTSQLAGSCASDGDVQRGHGSDDDVPDCVRGAKGLSPRPRSPAEGCRR